MEPPVFLRAPEPRRVNLSVTSPSLHLLFFIDGHIVSGELQVVIFRVIHESIKGIGAQYPSPGTLFVSLSDSDYYPLLLGLGV